MKQMGTPDLAEPFPKHGQLCHMVFVPQNLKIFVDKVSRFSGALTMEFVNVT